MGEFEQVPFQTISYHAWEETKTEDMYLSLCVCVCVYIYWIVYKQRNVYKHSRKMGFLHFAYDMLWWGEANYADQNHLEPEPPRKEVGKLSDQWGHNGF